MVLLRCDVPEPRELQPEATQAVVSSPAPSTAKSGSSYLAWGCRLVRVQGAVRDSRGRQLSSGSVLRGERWLTLPNGARAELQFQKGGKRFVVEGPATLLPCVAGEEVFIVGQGVLRTRRPPGRRPAAEALWATPQRAIRYGDASLEVVVTAEQLRVRVERGEARTVGPGSAVVTAGLGTVVVPSSYGASGTRLARCTQAAEAAFQRSTELLQARGVRLAKRASAQVEARRLAEEHCAVAAASALQQLTGEELRGLLARLDEARARLRAIPKLVVTQ